MRKEQKIRREQEELKKAAKETYMDTKNFAKSKRQEEFGGSGSNFGHGSNAKTLAMKYQNSNKLAAEEKKKVKIGLGDNQSIDLASLC